MVCAIWGVQVARMLAMRIMVNCLVLNVCYYLSCAAGSNLLVFSTLPPAPFTCIYTSLRSSPSYQGRDSTGSMLLHSFFGGLGSGPPDKNFPSKLHYRSVNYCRGNNIITIKVINYRSLTKCPVIITRVI